MYSFGPATADNVIGDLRVRHQSELANPVRRKYIVKAATPTLSNAV